MTRSAAAAAGLFLSSCFGERVSTAPRPRPSYGRIPRELDTRWPIKHVLYLMLENRSFDNLFGRFPGARGTQMGVRWGREVPLVRCPEWLPGDLPHDLGSWETSFNDGAMDGFAIGDYGPHFAYSQFAPGDVPNYFRWAKRFVLCDNVFASVAGPSYPNHLFFVAGQAGGAIENPENILTRVSTTPKSPPIPPRSLVWPMVRRRSAARVWRACPYTFTNTGAGVDERRPRRPRGVHGLWCFRGRPLCSPAAREERDMDSSVLWVVVAVVGFILLILLFRTTRGRRG
jgi:hypothetical protein